MSYSHRVAIMDNKAAKQKAALINERRKQAQQWLRRQSEDKKQSTVTSGAKDK